MSINKPENVKCPECDGEMVPRTSSYGKFWGCKNYPQCKGVRNSLGEAPNQHSDDLDEHLPPNRMRDNDRNRFRR